MAGEVGGGLLLPADVNFCQQQNISDVVIPFISDCGTAACTQSFHICFLVSHEVILFSFAGLSFLTTCTASSGVTAPVSFQAFVKALTVGIGLSVTWNQPDFTPKEPSASFKPWDLFNLG